MSDRKTLDEILSRAVNAGASDVHLHAGAPIILRVHGEMVKKGSAGVPAQVIEAMIRAILDDEQQDILEKNGELDFSYSVKGIARFRCNAFKQRAGLDVVMHTIRTTPPALAELSLPDVVADVASYRDGLVLVTGPAGCGKTSTLAGIVNSINESRREHVLTLEDPIEYVHQSRRAVINQRQVGRHTATFTRSLRAALRQDPDVIVIGELRDLETTELALTAAETGHLVLSTQHTNGAIQTIDRMINTFPPREQPRVRIQLANILRAVVCQKLARKVDGSGRIVVCEILIITPSIAQLVRDNDTQQIRSVMQLGASKGMCTFDETLVRLAREKVITRQEARRHATPDAKFA